MTNTTSLRTRPSLHEIASSSELNYSKFSPSAQNEQTVTSTVRNFAASTSTKMQVVNTILFGISSGIGCAIIHIIARKYKDRQKTLQEHPPSQDQIVYPNKNNILEASELPSQKKQDSLSSSFVDATQVVSHIYQTILRPKLQMVRSYLKSSLQNQNWSIVWMLAATTSTAASTNQNCSSGNSQWRWMVFPILFALILGDDDNNNCTHTGDNAGGSDDDKNIKVKGNVKDYKHWKQQERQDKMLTMQHHSSSSSSSSSDDSHLQIPAVKEGAGERGRPILPPSTIVTQPTTSMSHAVESSSNSKYNVNNNIGAMASEGRVTRTRSQSLAATIDSDASGGTGTSMTSAKPRYLEMLVHNVSHTDLVLSLGLPSSSSSSSSLQEDGDFDETDGFEHDGIRSSSKTTKFELVEKEDGEERCSDHDEHCGDYREYSVMEKTPRMKNSAADTIAATKNIRNRNKGEHPHVLCRPRFSAFDLYSRRILKALSMCSKESRVRQQQGQQKEQKQDKVKGTAGHGTNVISATNDYDPALYSAIMSFPSYERSDSTPRYSLVTPRPSRQCMLPVGFNLLQLMQEVNRQGADTTINTSSGSNEAGLELTEDDLQSLRLRDRDIDKMKHCFETDCVHSPRLKAPKIIGEGQGIGENESYSNAAPTGNSNNIQTANISKKMPLLHLDAVFFPLLSCLMRRWHAQIADKYGSSNKKRIKKVIILVSGVGTPRNWTHSMTGNSTQACAELMEIFIHTLYPDVTVVRIHSETEIFRYDENITFAKQELMPCIDAYRDAHARGESYPDEISEKDWIMANGLHQKSIVNKELNPFDPDWKQTFSVTLSFASGAPARTHAIQTSLRPYRPTFFHFWQLKTFWHESKICDDDIEIHSFEDMETVPAMEVNKTSSSVQMVVEEMKTFRKHFLKSLQDGGNDIRNFWLRKSKKPVLAVLLVQRPGEDFILYRGTNMEVSMPTGSLCAERNVIGTALAAHPGLKREHLKMVAVLAVPLPKEDAVIPIPSPPPGVDDTVCSVISEQEKGTTDKYNTLFLPEVVAKLSQHQRPENIRRSMSIGSFASVIDSHDTERGQEVGCGDLFPSWVIEGSSADSCANKKVSSLNEAITKEGTMGNGTTQKQRSIIPLTSTSSPDEIIVPSLHLEGIGVPNEIEAGYVTSSTWSSTPVRRIKLHSYGERNSDGAASGNTITGKMSGGHYRRKKKRTIVVHSPEDINPLKPCGACNEWLKKIAESNPSFKVITFTDADSNGVYVTPCQE